MRTVPVEVATLALQLSGRDVAVLAGAGRLVGSRTEVELAALAAADPQAAEVVSEYSDACSTFWGRLSGGGAAGAYVATRREVCRAQQRNTKTEKKDLVAHLVALEEVPGLGEVVVALTEADVDLELVRRLGAPFETAVEQEGSWTTTTLKVEGQYSWPQALGGPQTPGEVRRVITLRTSQAAWRDRRNRRLAEVLVEVDEVWPDTAGK